MNSADGVRVQLQELAHLRGDEVALIIDGNGTWSVMGRDPNYCTMVEAPFSEHICGSEDDDYCGDYANHLWKKTEEIMKL